jgi:pilus assembly protein TadC
MGMKLAQAGIFERPEDFIRKSFMAAFYMTTLLGVVVMGVLIKFQVVKGIIIIILPVLFILFFSFLIRKPDVIIIKKQHEIDREIVFAARFLVIELESGVPIYDAMKSVARSYPVIGKYFREILNSIDMGTPIEDAINDGIELTPSQNFRKFLWQIYNSLKTGADLADALGSTTDQIAEEQIITVKEYGRKLNPLVMFYMVVAVIFPSIGVIMIIVFSTFFALKINLTILIGVALGIALVQFMFLNIIKAQRPAVSM